MSSQRPTRPAATGPAPGAALHRAAWGGDSGAVTRAWAGTSDEGTRDASAEVLDDASLIRDDLASAQPLSAAGGGRQEASRLTAAEPDASHLAVAGRDASPSKVDASQPERDASARASRDASRLTGETRRICAWCTGPIPAAARRDAICCSKRCRQARHRFVRSVGRAAVADGRALRLAYADPPYPGNARLYRDHPDYAGEVDHPALIRRLCLEYDGWALSTSAAALPAVLASCPPDVRVAAWYRGERPTASRWPLSAWEPVIYRGGRPADPSRPVPQARRTDSLVCGVAALTTLPGRVTGTKPAAFCAWVFALLGAAPGDTLDDLFPGSGAVTRAWAAYTAPEPDASRVAGAGRVASGGERHDTSGGPAGDASCPTPPATQAGAVR